MTKFDDKVVVVLGATSEGGMGEAVARDLAGAGAKVVVSGRRREQAETLAKEFDGCGFACDVADETQLAALMAYAADEVGDGHIDIVVNASAALIGPGLLRDIDAATLAASAQVNLVGQVMAMKHAAARMRSGGVYLQFSSYSAVQATPTTGSYAICKAGVEHALRIAAIEWGGEGIRFVGLAPGIIFTPLTAFINNAEVEQTVSSVTPLGRMVSMDDVAATVRYLVSDACFETGQVYPLTGGVLLTRALGPEEFVVNAPPVS
jgi:NAD(P)-dependent dehydrogenase (short-subunit alcohol dehydrogenase family)